QAVTYTADDGQPRKRWNPLGQPPGKNIQDKEDKRESDSQDFQRFRHIYGEAENKAHEEKDERNTEQVDVRYARQAFYGCAFIDGRCLFHFLEFREIRDAWNLAVTRNTVLCEYTLEMRFPFALRCALLGPCRDVEADFRRRLVF